jgi:sugar O-acyltransferase (sialic acid O-acetyltransferase NeuD family)
LKKSSLVLLGAGGHCKSILDTLFRLGQFERVGIVDINPDSCSIMGVPVVGTDECLPALMGEGYSDAFVAVGSVGNAESREKLYERASATGFNFPNIVDPTAIIGKGTKLGVGIYIGRGAIIGPECTIGDGAILNSGCIVEHECAVGEFAHISPGATICGNVRIGRSVHVGAGAVVIQGLCVGDHVLIGAGSVVIDSIDPDTTFVGNPATRIR